MACGQNGKVPCVFITHQVLIKCPPLLQWLVSLCWYRINLRFIKRYTQCWISPDVAGEKNLFRSAFSPVILCSSECCLHRSTESF